MKKADLVAYLSGTQELLEFSPTAAMVGSSNPLSQPSVRGERLQHVWDEMMVRLWALWADILDINEQCYEEARPVLEELKSVMPQQCKAAMPTFKILLGLVQKYVFIDKYTPAPQLKLFFARMKYLCEELRYICEQFDPEVPRAPETPVKNRQQWDQDQVLKRKDAKMAKSAQKPGGELGNGEEELDPEMQGDAPVDAQHVVFEPTQAMQSPTGTFMPDRKDGQDQAGQNNIEPTTARGKAAPQGDQAQMGAEEPGDVEDPEDMEDPETDLSTDEFPNPEDLPADQGPERNQLAMDPNATASQASLLQPRKAQAAPVQPGQTAIPLPAQQMQPQPGMLPGQQKSQQMQPQPGAAPVPGEEEPEEPEQGAPNGAAPAPAAGKKPPFQGGAKGEAKPPKDKAEKKPTKKLRESVSAKGSIVLAGFVEALAHETELEAHFLTAGSALRACLEAKSDVSSAHVEIGEATPGGLPRLDLFVEWQAANRPSDCYGYSRIWLDEDVGLVVMDASDRVQDVLRFDEGLTDDAVTGRIYSALTEVYDPSTSRIWEKARVIPALYRLVERAQRGEEIPLRAFAQTIDCLRGTLGMQESIHVPGTSIRLYTTINEDTEVNLRESCVGFNFSWGVHTPVGTYETPSLQPFDGSVSAPEAVKEALEFMRQKALEAPTDYACQVSVRQLEAKLQHLYDLPRIEETAHWCTPNILVNIREGTVGIKAKDKVEVLPKTTTDEDVTARIASMAYQKESTTGPVYEPILNKPGSALTEVYSQTGLSLAKVENGYRMSWHGKPIGSLDKLPNGLWGREGLTESQSPYIAASNLAKAQGLHETELMRHSLRLLSELEDSDFNSLCEAVGLDSKSNRTENMRQMTRKLQLMEFGDNWSDCFERQLSNPDAVSYTEALVYAVSEMGLTWGAISYADAHWKEFL